MRVLNCPLIVYLNKRVGGSNLPTGSKALAETGLSQASRSGPEFRAQAKARSRLKLTMVCTGEFIKGSRDKLSSKLNGLRLCENPEHGRQPLGIVVRVSQVDRRL